MDRLKYFAMGVLAYMLLLNFCKTPEEPKPVEPSNIEIKDTQVDTQIDMSRVRGWDYQRGMYRMIPTDEEVRELRRNNPELIIRAPGRIILNERQLHEKYIEEYIEDNYDDILDKYQD